MKKLLILLCAGLLFSGCNTGDVFEVRSGIPDDLVRPSHVVLRNQLNEFMSFGVAVEDSMLARVSHQQTITSDDLFLGDNELEFDVSGLLFDIDFWRIREGDGFVDVPEFSQENPLVGASLYRMDNREVYAGEVTGVQQDYFLLSGYIGEESLGSPVFDEKGVVYGIVHSGDRSLREIKVLKMTKLLEFWAENRE